MCLTPEITQSCLFIALYAREGISSAKAKQGEYHWAFLTAPKPGDEDVESWRYLLEQTVSNENIAQMRVYRWVLQTKSVPLTPHDDVIARIMIADIIDLDDTKTIIKALADPKSPFQPRTIREAAELSVAAKTWVGEVVKDLERKGDCCKQTLNWPEIEAVGIEFARRTVNERLFDREVAHGNHTKDKIPTVDMTPRSAAPGNVRGYEELVH